MGVMARHFKKPSLRLLNPAFMVLDLSAGVFLPSIIIDRDEKNIPFVMLQPLIVPLAFDLGQGRLDILIIFQLDKKRRDVRIFR